MSESPSPPRRSRAGLVRFLIAIAVLAGLFWAVHFVRRSLVYEETDDAYLQGHIHLVSARMPGTVREVLVTENQIVQAGQLLARLDPLEYQIGRQKAVAALAHAKAMELQATAAVERMKATAAQTAAQVTQAEAQVQESTARLDVADVDFGRNQRLFQGDVRAVSKSEVDTTKSTVAATRAALNSAKANLESTRAQALAGQSAVQAAEAEHTAAQAAIAVQEAAMRDAERELSYADLPSPTAGRIGNKNVEAGNRVQGGQALFAVVAPEVWILANFKETQLRQMRPGQPVEITVDAIASRTFTGKVDSFSPATGAQFALLPADNATGNFTKVVQRVPVKIVFDPESIRGVEDRLQPGLSTVVSVRIK